MADTKTTGLPSMTAPIQGTDVVVIADVANGTTKKITVATLTRPMMSIIPAGDFALSTAAGVQSAFSSVGDVWTLKANTTYFFEGQYYITKSANSVSVAMAFALGGSITSILYGVWGQNAAADTTGTTGQFTFVDTVSSTVVAAAATTANFIKFSGIIRTNAAGTVTPQINFSGTAAGSPTMKANSYITFREVGTDTENQVGVVA